MNREGHKFYYIYRTTCTVTGRFYIGKRSTDNENDNYLGSGVILVNSVKKYGKKNHTKEILEFCEDFESLNSREKEYISEEILQNKLCMNLKCGGEGGFISDEHYKEMSRKSQIKVKELMKDEGFVKRKNLNTKLGVQKFILENGGGVFTGKNHSEETKDLMSKTKLEQQHGVKEKNSQFGTCWIKKEGKVSIKIKKEDFEKYEIEGWYRGRTVIVTEKMKNSRKNIDFSGEKNPSFGTYWIYNLELKSFKKIRKEELQTYLDQGWVKGRKIKFN